MSYERRETLSEKYRPRVLEDLVGNELVKRALVSFAKSREIPHLLLFGPPGTGKTTSAKAMCKEVLGRSEMNVLDLNASDERGIDVVREKIKVFASTQGIVPSLKIVILDEADSMTKDAQNALRRIIEVHSRNVRFFVICNYSTKIIPAIKSRCAPFRFAPIKTHEISDHIRKIAAIENISITSAAAEMVSDISGGDLRKALNTLEGLSLHGTITEETVNRYYPTPENADLFKLHNSLFTNGFSSIKLSFTAIKESLSLSTQRVLDKISEFLVKSEGEVKGISELMRGVSEITHRLSKGCSEEVQENAAISLFVLNR